MCINLPIDNRNYNNLHIAQGTKRIIIESITGKAKNIYDSDKYGLMLLYKNGLKADMAQRSGISGYKMYAENKKGTHRGSSTQKMCSFFIFKRLYQSLIIFSPSNNSTPNPAPMVCPFKRKSFKFFCSLVVGETSFKACAEND